MRNVVVVGGGFAGLAAARMLERRLPSEWTVTLLSEENYITYTPLLSEVVGASLAPLHAVAPVRMMLKRALYRRAAVQAVDFRQRVLRYGAAVEHALYFDHLILACGSVPNLEFIEGMAAYAIPLKTLGDALHIRNSVFVALERGEMEGDARERDMLTTFIVVGGGSSGVEVAGAISDLLRDAARYYPRLRQHGAQVRVLEGGDRLLAEFPPTLGEAALRSMREHGIDVRLDTRAVQVTAQGVKTAAGEWIAGANVICTIGTQPSLFVRGLEVPKERGRIKTRPDMSVPGRDGVWAIGDCALVVNAATGELSPQTAQFAVRQGREVAANVLHEIEGKPLRAFAYVSRGAFACIGHRRAVADVYGLRLSGFAAWLLWRAVYLSMLPTALRKLQVFSEWTLDLVFTRDMTQLHLGRSVPDAATAARRSEDRVRASAWRAR